MAAATKPRLPRLRASCDGCFLAKVKCSKARPICSRCLTCGIECRYSPSSRAGKPKASESAKNQQQRAASNSRSSPPVTNEGMIYAVDTSMAGVYQVEAGWPTPTISIDEALSRNQSISSGLTFMGVDGATVANMDAGVPGDMYDPTMMPWTPPNDMPAFIESPGATNVSNGHSRSQSYDLGCSAMGWVGSSSPEVLCFNQVSTPPTVNYFPSPTATPNMRPVSPRSTTVNSTAGSCTCFTVCLQSLQALHNATISLPFDLVLSLNRKAVDGCAAMIACTRCMSRSGTHTAAMLLATVLGAITASYKSASQSYFEQGGMAKNTSTAALSGPGGMGFGGYSVDGEVSRCIELEILAIDLRRLEEVHSLFREVCHKLPEDPELGRAMIDYLGQGLGCAMQVVSHRNGDMGHGVLVR